jgi:mersacidin/lichenicidin family type 2 lantibiotic
MLHVNIIRAWKDEEYRKRLTDAEKAVLPVSPVGLIELTDEDMNLTAGAFELDDGTSHGCLAP